MSLKMPRIEGFPRGGYLGWRVEAPAVVSHLGHLKILPQIASVALVHVHSYFVRCCVDFRRRSRGRRFQQDKTLVPVEGLMSFSCST